MSDRLSSVADQLRSEREVLASEVKSLKDGLAEREAEVSRIDKALKALGEKPTNQKARKPAATQDEVLEAIRSVLSFGGTLSEDDLRSQVETRIVDEGRSRMGFALRFKEALQDDSLQHDESGYSLTTNQLQSA